MFHGDDPVPVMPPDPSVAHGFRRSHPAVVVAGNEPIGPLERGRVISIAFRIAPADTPTVMRANIVFTKIAFRERDSDNQAIIINLY